MGDELRLTPRETVEVRTSTPELLEVEGRWSGGGKPPPAHYHPSQDEHFEVLEGSLSAVVGGERRELGLGDVLDIPRGTPHQMWNPVKAPARAIWQTRPAGRTEEWFRSIDGLFQERSAARSGRPGRLAFAAYLTEYRDVFRLASPPDLVARPLLAFLGVLGRLRGYRPRA